MEQVAYGMVAFLIGWTAGFATFGFLVWHTVNKTDVKVPVTNRSNVRDLYPPKDNN